MAVRKIRMNVEIGNRGERASVGPENVAGENGLGDIHYVTDRQYCVGTVTEEGENESSVSTGCFGAHDDEGFWMWWGGRKQCGGATSYASMKLRDWIQKWKPTAITLTLTDTGKKIDSM